MISHQPPPVRLAQIPTAQLLPAVPPPSPDVLFTGYTGIPGLLETMTVIAITGAGAWVGIKTGLRGKGKYMKAAGWVGGIGSALLGLLYLGSKSGIGQMVGLPAVRITPV